MIDALKRASAARITAVIPYFGYARQDRKVAPRTPITSKLVADLITTAGTDRVLTMDLHAGQIQGFFNIPVDHLYAAPVMLADIKERFPGGWWWFLRMPAVPNGPGLLPSVSMPDWRSSTSAAAAPMSPRSCISSATSQARSVMIVDDMIDTAGTLCQAAKALKEQGASEVFACATHAVLSGPALERINDSCLRGSGRHQFHPDRRQTRRLLQAAHPLRWRICSPKPSGASTATSR